MRAVAVLRIISCLAAIMWSATASAQVTEAQRAAARELFKQGDELQRSGRFPEALDKFERAQQVFSAPTNMLRIAECDAAVGRLVESAEAYRQVVRTPLPAGAPQAFQAAVDQARAELGQVEPRVPRLVVQVQPPGVSNLQMQIDGQNVPAALVGEPVPLDPGTHKVIVFAPGYVSSEQPVLLKERDTKTVPFTLKPLAGVTYEAPVAGGDATPAPPSQGPAVPPGTPPPPPPMVETGVPEAPRKSRTGLLLGAHLGWELTGGSLPIDPGTSSSTPIDTSAVAGGGVALALDGGLRFARQWYAGLTIEHAQLGSGSLSASASTWLLGVVVGLIVNPDRASLYGEAGLGSRWLSYTPNNQTNNGNTTTLNSPEVTLGAGLWIPAGSKLRLLPKATVGFGTFSPKSSTTASSQTHDFVMLGVAGFYNIDL